MKSALVTGASGMLGSYVVKRLHADGWPVTALVRDPVRSAWLEKIGATLIQGDILDVDSLEKAALGQDVIFHTAAAIGTGSNPNSIWIGNVIGTAAQHCQGWIEFALFTLFDDDAEQVPNVVYGFEIISSVAELVRHAHEAVALQLTDAGGNV